MKHAVNYLEGFCCSYTSVNLFRVEQYNAAMLEAEVAVDWLENKFLWLGL